MTTFTRSVYAVVSAIPSGSVTTYGTVAAMVGRPRAPRAVGGALSATPDELDLPWWRVINSSGRISTPSIHHTAQIQRALLEEECVHFSETGRLDWDVYEWNPSDADLERLLETVGDGGEHVGGPQRGGPQIGTTRVGSASG